jgi:hypothetical protein
VGTAPIKLTISENRSSSVSCSSTSRARASACDALRRDLLYSLGHDPSLDLWWPKSEPADRDAVMTTRDQSRLNDDCPSAGVGVQEDTVVPLA